MRLKVKGQSSLLCYAHLSRASSDPSPALSSVWHLRRCSSSVRASNLRATGGCRRCACVISRRFGFEQGERSAAAAAAADGGAAAATAAAHVGDARSRWCLVCRPALVPHPPCLRTGSCPSGHSEWPASRRACRAAARLLTGWLDAAEAQAGGRTDAQWQAAVATRRQMLNDLNKAHPGASGSQGGAGVCCRAASALSIRPAAACFPSPQAAV